MANVTRAEGLTGPISLNVLTIADSGERKTTLDNLLCKPIKDWENKKCQEYVEICRGFECGMLIWSAKMEGLKDSLKKSKNQSRIEEIEIAINELMLSKPQRPIIPRIIYADCTPEALAKSLALGHHSGALISSEAGAILGGHSMNNDSIMRNLSLLNILWDGGSLCTDRASKDSFTLQGARLTICISVQHATFEMFLHKSKGLARGIGFLARFLCTSPISTQGTRLFKKPQKLQTLEKFYQKINDILELPLNISKNGEINPVNMNFSPEAEKIWIDFYNEIEVDLGAGGLYADVKDIASKIADNAARIAAHFSIVEGNLHNIHHQTMMNATILAKWYLEDFKKYICESMQPYELQIAVKLKEWLVAYCLKNDIDIDVVSTRTVSQLGPNPVRKDAKRYIQMLCDSNNVFWLEANLTTRFRVNQLLLKQYHGTRF